MREALAFACGAAAALLFCLAAVVAAASPHHGDGQPTTDVALFSAREPVYEPIPAGMYMPMYMQDDVQWGHIDYAGGTIADSVCGLACAAMAVKATTMQDVTPLTLAEAVGETCLTDGVNDPEKFAQWISTTYADYGIDVSEKLYRTEQALRFVDGGWLCFAGLSGTFGDSVYGGHVVLIWHAGDDGYWVRDPASAANSSRAFTEQELMAVDFRYFVCLRGGNYARN